MGKELLVLVLVLALSAATPELPEYLKRCSRNVNRIRWNDCLKHAIEDGFAKLKKGEKSINLEAYDPLKIDKIVTTKNGVLISLDVNQKNTEIRGFGDGIRLDKVDFNFDKKVFSASILVPKLTLDSYQVLKGKIVGIPLTWKGGMTSNITKVKCDFAAPFEPITVDGKEYLKFDDHRLKLHLDVDHVRVRHKESTPADRVVANAADTIINSNWRLVFNVLKPSYEDVFRKQLAKSLIGLFSSVPVDGIFLN
ncbi:UNVERIFIED_CONTAM: hypothetical protein PYX00_006070 [Menopon gallinae]|uniref:Circadian clock-controlled protein n=1 Tax=Menopon gallinae TaxID=328185 RepID=A0AAW2HTW8_9NEOP